MSSYVIATALQENVTTLATHCKQFISATLTTSFGVVTEVHFGFVRHEAVKLLRDDIGNTLVVGQAEEVR